MANPITIEGNVTGDPRVHTFNDGKRVANFTVACNTSKKNQQGGWDEIGSQFFDCAAPDHLVDAVMNNIRKGVPVIVSGRLDFRDYTTREGVQGKAMEVRVDNLGYSLRFHDVQGGKRQRGAAPGGAGSAASHYGQPQTAAATYGQQPAQQAPAYGQPAQPQGQAAWNPAPAAPAAQAPQQPAAQQPAQGDPWNNQPGPATDNAWGQTF